MSLRFKLCITTFTHQGPYEIPLLLVRVTHTWVCIPFSSGFGKRTVGKSGSGICCSFTATNGGSPNIANALVANGSLTPCIEVLTNLTAVPALSDLYRATMRPLDSYNDAARNVLSEAERCDMFEVRLAHLVCLVDAQWR